jgi:hypothetical protein
VGVINDTFSTDPIHKGKGPGEKHLAFKPGEARIILNINFTAVGKNKRSALGCYFTPPKFEIVRRGVMLHLFTRLKHIFSCPFFFPVFTNIMFSYDPGQGLIRDCNTITRFQFLPDSYNITPALTE